jgi:DNA-binding beta-propeller fold protein YncE
MMLRATLDRLIPWLQRAPDGGKENPISSRLLLSLPRFAAFAAFGFAFAAYAATPTDGEIVVLEQGHAPTVPAALIGIDPATGQQRVISAGGYLSNEIGANPNGFAYDAARGVFWVVDRAAKLIQVNAGTGDQEFLLSVGSDPTAVAVESDGNLLVTDFHSGLLRVDPVSGIVSVLAQGGLIGGVSPCAVELDSTGAPIVSALTLGGNDVPGPPSRVIRVDPETGAQTLIAQITDGQFHDFAIQGNTALIAIGSRGYPSSMDQIASLDLSTGTLMTVVSGLQRAHDVDIDSQGRMVILDGCQFLSACAGSPVVYRSNEAGGLDPVSTDGYMFVPSRLTIGQEPACNDGIDDDGDGWIDYPVDPGCASPAGITESPACQDGIDNDGDGLADFPGDPGCDSPTDASEKSPGLDCDDDLDNDGDGLTDFPGDPGCGSPADASEKSPALVCDDDLDNDGDGLTDFPGDPGCDSLTDASENSPILVCDDGLDNDGDGAADYPADPGCRGALGVRENPQCQDGLNNDNWSGIDFDGGASVNGGVPIAAPDPQCTTAWKNKEAAATCGLGAELALVLPLIGVGCRRSRRITPVDDTRRGVVS